MPSLHDRSSGSAVTRPSVRSAVATLLAVSILAACTTAAGPPPSMAAPSPPAPSGASPSDQAARCTTEPPPAEGYPGWPGSGGGSSSSEGFVPVLGSQELAVGPSRFLLTIIDDANEPLASEQLGVTLRFFDLAADPATSVATTDATFLPVDDRAGFYRASVEFRCAGEWGVEVVGREEGQPDRSARVVFPVAEDTTTPSIGEAGPPSETPTAETPDEIAAISTDPDPDPDFYTTSIADGLGAGEPLVIAFATPAFCQTRTCGPMLDVMKDVAVDFKDRLTFIHVEPYELEQRDGRLQPVLDANGQLVSVQAARDWGLIIEPYTFVIDREGRVAAKFEGLAGADELREAFEAVTGA